MGVTDPVEGKLERKGGGGLVDGGDSATVILCLSPSYPFPPPSNGGIADPTDLFMDKLEGEGGRVDPHDAVLDTPSFDSVLPGIYLFVGYGIGGGGGAIIIMTGYESAPPASCACCGAEII